MMNAATFNLTTDELAQLTRYARRHSRCQADADDLVQEMMVKALESYDAAKGAAVKFCQRVLRNLAVDALRRNVRFSVSVEAAEIDIADTRSQNAEAAADMAAEAMAAVAAEIARREAASNARTRATAVVVKELFVDGAEDSEVAARHNLTANAVYILRHNVLTAVRREMATAAA